MRSMDMELSEAIGSIAFAFGAASASTSMETKSSRARASFQWGGTIFASILLILNAIGRGSRTQSNLLVLYLFTSFPGVLFKIVRGQFGSWVAFLAIAANLFFPETFPASRFLVFVVTPNWIADGLRDSMFGGVFCLIIAILLVITVVRGLGGLGHCRCGQGATSPIKWLHGVFHLEHMQGQSEIELWSTLFQWKHENFRRIGRKRKHDGVLMEKAVPQLLGWDRLGVLVFGFIARSQEWLRLVSLANGILLYVF